MKIQLLLPILGLYIVFSCSPKEETAVQKPLSEQNLEFEIYDSLVVDYLGNLFLADISKDRKSFLLIDHKTDSVFIVDSDGTIKSRFMRKGEGPGNYRDTRYNRPMFLTDIEIVIPAWKGFYIYSLSGDFLRSYELDFFPTSSLIDLYNNKMAIIGNQVFYPWEGRIAEEYGTDGKKFQLATNRVESLDLETGHFTPAIKFPSESKFKTGEKSYLNLHFNTRLSQFGDSIFVTFRNEPKIFAYHFLQLDSPASIYEIPFEEFIEKAPKFTENFGTYDMKAIYGGSVNTVIPTGDQHFLIYYTRGLKDEEYDQLKSENKDDASRFYEELGVKNKVGWILFDGKSVSPHIQKPVELGILGKYISHDEIWFTPEYQTIELDYVVLYKTRLVSK